MEPPKDEKKDKKKKKEKADPDKVLTFPLQKYDFLKIFEPFCHFCKGFWPLRLAFTVFQPKTAAEIAREMERWAKRQEKVKLTFKQETTVSTTIVQTQKATVTKQELTGDLTVQMVEKAKVFEKFNKNGHKPIGPGTKFPGPGQGKRLHIQGFNFPGTIFLGGIGGSISKGAPQFLGPGAQFRNCNSKQPFIPEP